MAIGMRELRADLAAHIRRAAAGEVIELSIGGRSVAVLAPSVSALDPAAVVPPRRQDGRVADGAVSVWRNPRFDLLLRELRG